MERVSEIVYEVTVTRIQRVLDKGGWVYSEERTVEFQAARPAAYFSPLAVIEAAYTGAA